ncbi:hypothetical protein BpHYR1_007382 [Brachionus plicatilis]|uniref:Uncharacterized protein n=1 Tax=Brachionus plicatilis TaxID=10195 RepID=A0A3M7P1D1_BRAPC|nr:hypothetical protein BpHYR1_007382 [Brachionus plicatilis]
MRIEHLRLDRKTSRCFSLNWLHGTQCQPLETLFHVIIRLDHSIASAQKYLIYFGVPQGPDNTRVTNYQFIFSHQALPFEHHQFSALDSRSGRGARYDELVAGRKLTIVFRVSSMPREAKVLPSKENSTPVIPPLM